MRIVTRYELMELPPGTLYSEYEPCVFEGLFAKHETLRCGAGEYYPEGTATDWFMVPLICRIEDAVPLAEVEVLHRQLDNGHSVPTNLSMRGRDGCYDMDQLYAIYEQDDLLQLRTVIDKALSASCGRRKAGGS